MTSEEFKKLEVGQIVRRVDQAGSIITVQLVQPPYFVQPPPFSVDKPRLQANVIVLHHTGDLINIGYESFIWPGDEIIEVIE